MDVVDLNQTQSPPFESVAEVVNFIDFIENNFSWSVVGVLSDEDNRNVVITLLDDDYCVVAAFRANIPARDIADCVLKVTENGGVFFRCWQGNAIVRKNLQGIESINEIWSLASGQQVFFTTSEVVSFFERLETNERHSGRGKDFSKPTKETVYRDAHGRCMFTGCGERLDIDVITGKQGNYSYLAHNVASSEQGTRGIMTVSEKLSDDPGNIILMCDKHHRLIDTVAACDYTASTLTNMRAAFCNAAEKLLDGLKYEPIPAYAILWPVNSQVMDLPSSVEVSSSLSLIKRRLLNNINILSDNEDLLRFSPDILWKFMPQVIEKSAKEITQQSSHHGHHAALFAGGPMSALIGLGATLGNKNHYVPMLRFRDTGEWAWPSEEPIECCYEILGQENLVSGNEFVITVSLTASVPKLLNKARELQRDKNAQVIEINALADHMGNGAIPHPKNGKKLCSELQQLLHDLKAEYGAKEVHLLVCASNAASVFIGQAFDNNHPDVVVYDFAGDGMLPRLLLQNNEFKTTVSLPNF